jgi:hypothetical protein
MLTLLAIVAAYGELTLNNLTLVGLGNFFNLHPFLLFFVVNELCLYFTYQFKRK